MSSAFLKYKICSIKLCANNETIDEDLDLNRIQDMWGGVEKQKRQVRSQKNQSLIDDNTPEIGQ